jgi:LPXTG-motif cell wall-anchored protein
MPSKILAPNATNGVPQIDLLIRVIYANAQEQQVISNGHFALSVPGASVRQADNSIWFILVGVIVLLTISILTYWKRSNQHRRPIKSKAKE